MLDSTCTAPRRGRLYKTVPQGKPRPQATRAGDEQGGGSGPAALAVSAAAACRGLGTLGPGPARPTGAGGVAPTQDLGPAEVVGSSVCVCVRLRLGGQGCRAPRSKHPPYTAMPPDSPAPGGAPIHPRGRHFSVNPPAGLPRGSGPRPGFQPQGRAAPSPASCPVPGEGAVTRRPCSSSPSLRGAPGRGAHPGTAVAAAGPR